MPLDVDKISAQAAKMAAEAATTVNDIAKNAGPALQRASEHMDDLAEKGRPYVERAEREIKDVLDSVMSRGQRQPGQRPDQSSPNQDGGQA